MSTWPDDHLLVEVVEDFYEVRWHWRCSCGATGRWSGQFSAAAAMAWPKHFIRATGVRQPPAGGYEPWMRQATEASHGLRAADIQRAAFDDELPLESCVPVPGRYPWGALAPESQ